MSKVMQGEFETPRISYEFCVYWCRELKWIETERSRKKNEDDDEDNEISSDEDDDQPVFSLASGAYHSHTHRRDSSSSSSSSSSTSSKNANDTLIVRSKETSLVKQLESAASTHLTERSYQGLNPLEGYDEMGVLEPSKLERGRIGVARGYEEEERHRVVWDGQDAMNDIYAM